MSNPIEIYLGKNGQTFGPYTIEQFDAMKANPDFGTYTYIWDGRDSSPDWKPLEKAPAPPVPRKPGPGAPPPDEHHPAAASAQPAQRAPEPARSARPMLRGYDVPGIEALCHDARAVVGGKLIHVTDNGCVLVCEQDAVAPSFGSQSQVTLNLLDPRSGKSMNVPARLNGIRRQDGAWSFMVIWNGCPEIILQQLEKSA